MKNDIEANDGIERVVRVGQWLIQIGLTKTDLFPQSECGGARPCRCNRGSAQIDATAMTTSESNHEGKYPTRPAAQIEKVAGICELQFSNVTFQVALHYPRVLADIVAICFAPNLPHQGRIELLIKAVIALRWKFRRNKSTPPSTLEGWASIHPYVVAWRSLGGWFNAEPDRPCGWLNDAIGIELS